MIENKNNPLLITLMSNQLQEILNRAFRTWSLTVKSAIVTIILLHANFALAVPHQKTSDGHAAKHSKSQYYEFHNSFWINLHLTLFHEANAKPAPQNVEQGGATPLEKNGLSEQEINVWNSAVEFYRKHFGGRSLLFDDQMVNISNALGDYDNAVTLDARHLPADLSQTLNSAAVVYRKHWWKAHRKSNERWQAQLLPQLREMEGKVIPRLEQALNNPWPGTDRVDIAYFVDALGAAYTTSEPGHTTISSATLGNQGVDGLEIIFHEGAHLITNSLSTALSKECDLQKKRCTDLWHAVQFYTVGEIVRQELTKRGTKGYVPYAIKYGLWERGHWPKYLEILKVDWEPYLEGKSRFDTTIKSLVRDLD